MEDLGAGGYPVPTQTLPGDTVDGYQAHLGEECRNGDPSGRDAAAGLHGRTGNQAVDNHGLGRNTPINTLVHARIVRSFL